MQYLGIEYNMNHAPRLDPQYIPFGVWRAAYLKDAVKPIAIAVERDKGRVSVHRTCIHGTPEMAEANDVSIEAREQKIVKDLKSMLGIKVGVKVLEPKTIARSEGKAVRVIDKRNLYK